MGGCFQGHLATWVEDGRCLGPAVPALYDLRMSELQGSLEAAYSKSSNLQSGSRGAEKGGAGPVACSTLSFLLQPLWPPQQPVLGPVTELGQPGPALVLGLKWLSPPQDSTAPSPSLYPLGLPHSLLYAMLHRSY